MNFVDAEQRRSRDLSNQAVVVAAALVIWLMTFVVRMRRRGAVSGRDSIIGGVGTAMHGFTGDGKVWLEGESWAAHSTVRIEKGQAVVVRNLDGLIVEVEPMRDIDPADARCQS